jgi:hypothetical protein
MGRVITEADILGLIKSEEFQVKGKTTICFITLKNGFEVVGTSACVDPKNFKLEIGMKFAKEDAISRIWQLEGYRLQWELYEANEKRKAELTPTCCADPFNHKTKTVARIVGGIENLGNETREPWEVIYCGECGRTLKERKLG